VVALICFDLAPVPRGGDFSFLSSFLPTRVVASSAVPAFAGTSLVIVCKRRILVCYFVLKIGIFDIRYCLELRY